MGLRKKLNPFLNQADEKKKARSHAAAEHSPLCLQAKSDDDIDIMAVLMQDAIIPAANFHFNRAEKTFTLKANRFCWETQHDRLNHQKVHQRILSCLQFQNVIHVQHMNFKKGVPSSYYNLLTFALSLATDKSNSSLPLATQYESVHEKENRKSTATHLIDLIFSHDTRIRLHIRNPMQNKTLAVLIDSEETSYTTKVPAHTNEDMGRYIVANAIREYTSNQ